MNPKTFDTLKKILVERFAINPAHVQPSAAFQKELNMDSMDAVDLLLAINETFDIRIPEKTLEEVHTVEEMVVCIQKHKPKLS